MNAPIQIDERAAFETAYAPLHPTLSVSDIFERNGDGYAYLRVQGAWEGWQARAVVGEAQVPSLSAHESELNDLVARFANAPDVTAISDAQIEAALEAWFTTTSHEEEYFPPRMRAAIAAALSKQGEAK